MAGVLTFFAPFFKSQEKRGAHLAVSYTKVLETDPGAVVQDGFETRVDGHGRGGQSESYLQLHCKC
jgi:hypothetical protein